MQSLIIRYIYYLSMFKKININKRKVYKRNILFMGQRLMYDYSVAASCYRGSSKVDIHRSARGRHRTARLLVQDLRRHDQRRCRRSQTTQPRGTGSGYRAQVSGLSQYVA